MGTVVITGAGGFLGRGLCPRLAAAGWDVVALTRRRADVTDLDALRAQVDDADAVVHLAFPTRAASRREHPFESLREVLTSTSNVLQLAVECGARQVVLASSGKVYGAPRTLPQTEEHPLAPTTQLGALKQLAESVLSSGSGALAVRETLGVTTLRIFNVYGPGQRDEFVVPHVVQALRAGPSVRLGELDHRRDYIHLNDTAAAFATVLERPAQAGSLRALNVGSGVSTSVRELLTLLSAVSGVSPEIVQEPARQRPDEIEEERGDTTRLRALGWAPQVSLDEGLAALWADREPGQ